MRTISKIICWIFVAFFLFILINLVIGAIHYGGTKSYSEYLNNKDWNKSISEVYILKPKTWLSVFYELEPTNIEENITEEDIGNNEENIVTDVESENLTGTTEETDDNKGNHNPYDPDYEDEFNSFFGVASEETGDIIPVQEIENLEPAGFVVDENTED